MPFNALVAGIRLAAMAVMLPPLTATAIETPIQTPSSDVPLVSQGVSLEDDSPLESVPWQLSRWNGNPLNSELPAIDLELNRDTVNGSGGCNTYFGNLSHYQGQHLRFGAIASSRRACEPVVMQRETQYLQALAGVHKYRIDPDGNLGLAYHSDSETGTLEFTQINDTQ
ncbi:META domain-containing protein [Sodalinema sp.]|uniref:META domain-containing protein n=1 Tax=Sodalinema sp. TaxID=3080550 RepID=UPI00396F60B7